MLKKIFIFALLFVSLNSANIFLINVNQDDLELGIDKDKEFTKNSRLYYSAEFFSSYDEYEKNQIMLNGQLMLIGSTAIPGFSAGVGVKGFASKVDLFSKEYTASSLAIRAKVIYTLPILIKTYLTGSYGYSPKALSFGDLTHFEEIRAEINFEIIEGGMIYAGYRDVQMNFENIKNDYTFNESGYIGVKFVF